MCGIRNVHPIFCVKVKQKFNKNSLQILLFCASITLFKCFFVLMCYNKKGC
jgi:hypothetical protein